MNLLSGSNQTRPPREQNAVTVVQYNETVDPSDKTPLGCTRHLEKPKNFRSLGDNVTRYKDSARELLPSSDNG